MLENPFHKETRKIADTDLKANTEVVKELLSPEDAAEYAALQHKERDTDMESDVNLTEEEVAVLAKDPEGLLEKIDTSYDGGVVLINMSLELVRELGSYEGALNAGKSLRTRAYIDPAMLASATWSSPESASFDVFVLSPFEGPEVDIHEVVAEMRILGYRPLTLSEMTAFLILRFELIKKGDPLLTFEPLLPDGTHIPCLRFVGSNYMLWHEEKHSDFNEHCRLLFTHIVL